MLQNCTMQSELGKSRLETDSEPLKTLGTAMNCQRIGLYEVKQVG